MIIKACEERKVPIIRSTHYNQDPGMKSVSDLLEGIQSEGSASMPDAISDLLQEISSVSTISIFYTLDTDLPNKRKITDNKDDERDLLTDQKYLDLKQRMFYFTKDWTQLVA